MNTDQLAERSFKEVVEAASDLDFTGERIVPGKTAEALFREHEERYVFAGQYVPGKDVLDVACGTGIGTSFLRGAGARRVWGLDIAPDAISYAKVRYPECEFALSDATNLCLDDESVDVVISFETVEHVDNQIGFLMECRRVLKLGGVLICSTPNLEISRWSASNPFHTREFAPKEFLDLVKSAFPSAELFAQKSRSFLPYLSRKLILGVLEWLRLRRVIEGMLVYKRAPGRSRMEFVNDLSGLAESICRYTPNFLRQPTFLIAVAHKTPTHTA